MILFVGDSITHGTNWAEWIDFAEVQNISVPGFSTDDVLNQLPDIERINPAIISLLIGTNDIGNPDLNSSGEEVGQKVLDVVFGILSKNQHVKMVVNSILPRSEIFADRIWVANEIISSGVKDVATYVDCWPSLSVGKQLKDEYLLVDGFDAHLSDAGYAAWRSVLFPVLRKQL